METGKYCRLISFTTRPRRPNEVDGVNYDFITEECFRALSDEGEVIQSVNFDGCHYGTSEDQLASWLNGSKDAVVVVEPSGVDQFRRAGKKHGFDVIAVFVSASLSTLVYRFLKRAELDVQKTGALGNSLHGRMMNMLLVESNSWQWVESYDLKIHGLGDGVTSAEAVRMIEASIRSH